MRGFRCFPLSALRAKALQDLTSFVRDCYAMGVVAQDDRHCLPFESCELRSAIFPNRPFVGLSQIAAARDKLVALGVWLHKTTPRKEWLEIHPDYRHSEGQNETSYGEEPRAVQQGQLPFPPSVVPARAQKINGSRAESDLEENKKTIPANAEPRYELNPQALLLHDASVVNRFGEGGKQSKKESGTDYSRTIEQLCATPLGRRCRDFLGMPQIGIELKQSGAEWLRIIRDEADALAELLEQGERSRATMTTGKARAVWLTEHLYERRRAA